MKTILLTGGSGFIGHYIYKNLAKTYRVLRPTHDELDLCDTKEVEDFVVRNCPEIIIHNAAAGARPDNSSCPGIFDTNIRMFQTLEKYIPTVEKFINIDSGASFNHKKSIIKPSIHNDDYHPEDEYGMSKLQIARSVLAYKNGVNLRLYGCFGPMDHADRYITRCIMNGIKGLDIYVYDMYMDYFYVEDVPIVIDHCILNHTPQDIDLVYESSGLVTLHAIAREIYSLIPRKTGALAVNSGRMPFYYCGDPQNLKALDIKLNGLMNGIINTSSYYIRQWML